jgi:hypothetical protein
MSQRSGHLKRLGLLAALGGLAALLLALPGTGGTESAQADLPDAGEPEIGAPVTPRAVTVPLSAQRTPNKPGSGVVTDAAGLPTQAPPANDPEADPVFQGTDEGTDQLNDGPEPFSFTQELITDPGLNFAGITSGSNPPDTVGDVGFNHYIQMVNATQYQIFDKNGNDLSGGPLTLGNLWPALDPCNANAGDPIVVFDHLADRWLITQFAFPNHMCMAVSQTPDPTAGTWFLYTFNTLVFPDYPKIGVWPDGYYMTTYESPNLGAYVFDRANMLLGIPAGFVKFTIGSLGAPGVRDTRILPADLDGPAPPGGTPNYMVRTVDDQQDPGNPVDRIEIWEFAVNWPVPASSTFTNTQNITNAVGGLVPFDIMTCNRNGGGVRDCIPEPDTTSTVDALSNRPMMQLNYRNFAGNEAMVFNQTIDIAGSINGLLGFTPANEVAGIRWYELRSPAAGWAIAQQGTFGAQDPSATTEAQLIHRWMGSAAMDGLGNIGLGHSIVNDDDTNGSEIYPGIAYTGRRVDDPLNILPQGEKFFVNGTVSATGGFGLRWGDYSALSVDPSDDCTFWFTSHVAGGATRIGTFAFDNCVTVDTTKPVWTFTYRKHAMGPGSYVPGTWSNRVVYLEWNCIDPDPDGPLGPAVPSGVDKERGDLQTVYNDGVYPQPLTGNPIGDEGTMKGDVPDEYCIDFAGNIADPVDPPGPVMVDTKAPVCKATPSTTYVKRNTVQAPVLIDIDGTEATSGLNVAASQATITTATTGGASFIGPVTLVGAAPNLSVHFPSVSMGSSTAGKITINVTLIDNAGNTKACPTFYIKAK